MSMAARVEPAVENTQNSSHTWPFSGKGNKGARVCAVC